MVMARYITLILGMILSGAAFTLLSVFTARMRFGMMMASKSGSDTIAFQYALIIIVLCVMFVFGVLLTLLSIRNIVKSHRKAG